MPQVEIFLLSSNLVIYLKYQGILSTLSTGLNTNFDLIHNSEIGRQNW